MCWCRRETRTGSKHRFILGEENSLNGVIGVGVWMASSLDRKEEPANLCGLDGSLVRVQCSTNCIGSRYSAKHRTLSGFGHGLPTKLNVRGSSEHATATPRSER